MAAVVTTQPYSELEERMNGAPERENKNILQTEVPEGEEDLPQGIRDLVSLESVTVHQHLDSTVASLCFQLPSRYSLYDSADEDTQQILYAQEVSECYARQCLGAVRGFVMKFSNQQQQDVIRLQRPLRCPCSICWWWCCCVQELSIESPPGNFIGKIAEDRLCFPKYIITDDNEDLAYTIQMSCCLCMMCSNVNIEVCDARYEHYVVAVISKCSKGNIKDCCGSQNDFTIQFVKADLHVQDKILILGASFLIDYNFFERQQRSCC